MEVYDKIALRGKSLKGKNRVREQGSQWEIWLVGANTMRGQVLVSPLSSESDHNIRWIHLENDPDFEIVEA